MPFPVFRSLSVASCCAALLLAGAKAPPPVDPESEEAEAARDAEAGTIYYGASWIPQAEADRRRREERKRIGWMFETRADSSHVSVYSALPVAFTRRLAATLESGIEAYRGLYGPVWRLAPLPKSLRVYLFSDRDAFERAVRAAGEVPDGEDTCRYCPRGQLVCVLGKASDPGATLVDALRTLNTALDALLAPGEMPVWAQRGRGLYLAHSVRGRQVVPGFLGSRPEAATLLDEGFGLAELLSSGGSAFYSEQRAGREGLAWAWVHFLLHAEDGRYADGFRAYLSGKAARGGVADFERTVGRPADLEPAFRRYVAQVLLPGLDARKKVT